MPTPMGRKHTTLGKVLHWGFLVLYAYGIFKQIDDLSELEDTALLLFEIAFATLFLVIVILRYAYMRRFETFQGASVPVSAVHKKSARAIHLAMYLCLALLPLTGLAIAALYTQGVGEEALAMDAMISLHGLSADLSYVLIVIHVLAALYSRAKGEGVWTSMVPVFTETGPSENRYVAKLTAMEHKAVGKVEAFIASRKK